jgi:hypothetical protein
MFSQGADLEVVPTFFSESPVQRTHRIELEASSLPSTAPIFPNMTPDEFVLKGDFKLFGIMSVQLYSLQSPNVPGVHHQVSIPGDLSLGNLIPSVAHSGMDAIRLRGTTLTFRSHRNKTEPAGLMVRTTVHFAGFLQPVNLVLRDIFGQKDSPRIDMSCLLSTQPTAMAQVS